MSESFQITATRKDGADADRRIDALQLADGRIFPIDRIIAAIRAGDRFWTFVYGVRVGIRIDQHPVTRRDFLRTEGDGFPPNNLLRLPNC